MDYSHVRGDVLGRDANATGVHASWACFGSRVFCSDAALGGHGLCYGSVPAEDIRSWCRMADFRGGYSRFQGDDAEHVPGPDAPLPSRVSLPLHTMWWHRVGRPGGWEHINVEEAKALRWAVTHRAKMPGEQNIRCLHPVDNTSCVGAAAKGRSSSRSLNREMRKIAAVQLLAGHQAFYVWIASKTNPADAPSSWYGLRARRAARVGQLRDMSGPECGQTLSEGELQFFVMLSSAREEQVFDEIACAHGRAVGLRVRCISGHRPEGDLALDNIFGELMCFAREGRLAAVHIALPRDLCQRRMKGHRDSDMRIWGRRLSRYERALAVCGAMPARTCHSVEYDVQASASYCDGVIMSSCMPTGSVRA